MTVGSPVRLPVAYGEPLDWPGGAGEERLDRTPQDLVGELARGRPEDLPADDQRRLLLAVGGC